MSKPCVGGPIVKSNPIAGTPGTKVGGAWRSEIPCGLEADRVRTPSFGMEEEASFEAEVGEP
jgi:hypothetical protein